MVVFVGRIYYGGNTDDTITGTADADTLYGGGGADVISGGAGDDFLVGEAGADIINGGAGNDIISGGYVYAASDYDHGVDTLTGGAGADYFRFQFGFSGVTGNLSEIDHVTDFSSAEGDVIDLQRDSQTLNMAWMGDVSSSAFTFTVGQSFGAAPGVAYMGVYAWTNASTTYLIVDVNANGLLDVKDFAIAFDGAPKISVTDLIQRGDILQVGTGQADIWTGTSQADYYYGQGGDDIAHGGAGADEIHGGDGDDQLYGDDGADILVGDYGNDSLHGGAGDDTLYAAGRYTGQEDASNAKNYLYGDAGNDTLVGSNGVDYLDGGAGDDFLNGGSTDILIGGDGADRLWGGLSQDGGAGDDQLSISGVKTVTGGSGADVFSAELSPPYYSGSLDWPFYTTITDFKASEGDKLQLSFSPLFDNTFLVFRGAVGSDFALETGHVFSTGSYGPGFVEFWTWTTGGDTYLMVDADSDGKLSLDDFVLKLQGVSAISPSDFSTSGVGGPNGFVTQLGGSNAADIWFGSSSADIYWGLGGDDQLHGGEGADRIYGNEGADHIWGDAGDDYLYGGRGDDVIEGGDGDDTIQGGAGSDIIHGGAGNDNINASGSLAGDLDTVDSVNIVFGDAGNDSISGGASLHDQLHGGDGDDRIFGNGELWGDAGNDSLSSVGGAIMHGGDGDDILYSSAVATGANVLYGDAGADTMYGGYGPDIIYLDLGDRSVSGGSGTNIFYIGDVRSGETVQLNAVYGGDGQDTFVIQAPLSADLTLSGYSGDDLVDLHLASNATRVDLNLATAQDVGMGRLVLQYIQSVQGGDHGAFLTGNANANRLIGGAAADVLSGGKGADVLTGGGGDDVLDGGDGLDIATYSGAAADYSWTRSSDGTWTVKDLRAAAADGQDSLKSVEVLRFSDKTISLTSIVVDTLLRGGPDSNAAGLEAKIASGALTLDGAIASVVKTAQASTSVATLTYEFFTGKIPSQLGIDYLVSPTGPNPNGNINGPLYNYFNTVNRYINFAVALGKNGEAKDSFAAEYGSLSLFEATRHAYAEIFGGTPNDAKVHQLLDTRIDFLAGVGGDGAEGIGTKAAMVGFLLAAAATESIGVMAKANEAWLTDLADGSAPFAIDILDPAKGYYKADYVFGG